MPAFGTLARVSGWRRSNFAGLTPASGRIDFSVRHSQRRASFVLPCGAPRRPGRLLEGSLGPWVVRSSGANAAAPAIPNLC